MSNAVFRPTLEFCESLGLEYPRPSGPYVKRSTEYVEYARGLRNFPVPERLSIEEAAAIFDIWVRDNAVYKRAPLRSVSRMGWLTDLEFRTRRRDFPGEIYGSVWERARFRMEWSLDIHFSIDLGILAYIL